MAAIELAKCPRDADRAFRAYLEARVEGMVACERCSHACLDEQNVRMLVRCIVSTGTAPRRAGGLRRSAAGRPVRRAAEWTR